MLDIYIWFINTNETKKLWVKLISELIEKSEQENEENNDDVVIIVPPDEPPEVVYDEPDK